MNIKKFLVILLLIYSCKTGSSGNISVTVEQENEFVLNIVTTDKDSLIFNRLFHELQNKNLSLEENIITIGKFFIGTPYITSTLDTEEEEHLIINLREMDCVTFVEYVTSLAICFTNKRYDFNDFAEILTLVRYQSGKIDGYLSRLHYFSHWLQDNSNKGILEIISDSIGNDVFDNKIDFMSSNSHLYKQLNDTALINKLKIIEKNISLRSMRYISKNNIKNIENKINNGDIIALASSIKGLDISHVGFAFKQNGRIYLLHASSTNKKIEVTSFPLDDYLKERNNITGVLVGRFR